MKDGGAAVGQKAEMREAEMDGCILGDGGPQTSTRN